MTLPTSVKHRVEDARRHREWRAKNKDRVKASKERYAAKNPEKIRRASLKSYHKHHAKNLEYSKKYHKAHPCSSIERILIRIKSSAKKKGVTFSLTSDDVSIPSICPVLGIPLSLPGKGRRTWNTASFDRKDNTKGYVKGNVVVVSWRANWLKANATADELRALVKYMDGERT